MGNTYVITKTEKEKKRLSDVLRINTLSLKTTPEGIAIIMIALSSKQVK